MDDANVVAPSDLKVINLWGAPGVGKSTTASGLFNLMKTMGLKVELVTEVAKDHVYERNFKSLANSLLVLGQQDHRLRRLVGEVEWVVTDSPLPGTAVYMTEEYRPWLEDAAFRAYRRYTNYDFLVIREKAYQPWGRTQSEPAALALDAEFRELFLKSDSAQWLGANTGQTDRIISSVLHIPGTADAPYRIYDHLTEVQGEFDV